MKKVLLFLAISMTVSFFLAVTFVITLSYSLHKTDMAYGHMPLTDPFEMMAMFIIALLLGFIAWPLSLFFGWYTPLKSLVPIVTIPPFLLMLIGALLNPFIGLLGACLGSILALFYCKFIYNKHSTQAQPSENSPISTNVNNETINITLIYLGISLVLAFILTTTFAYIFLKPYSDEIHFGDSVINMSICFYAFPSGLFLWPFFADLGRNIHPLIAFIITGIIT